MDHEPRALQLTIFNLIPSYGAQRSEDQRQSDIAHTSQLGLQEEAAHLSIVRLARDQARQLTHHSTTCNPYSLTAKESDVGFSLCSHLSQFCLAIFKAFLELLFYIAHFPFGTLLAGNLVALCLARLFVPLSPRSR
ncbi:hypothetical protein P171DRAFT_184333 [Karstenula rhodostoma CBS 690.94]|uniref:Uncharacterized protein n=1 Tax=Karstenula rhodostoma CBS 690.94 TaxID=1392251 RepID=A0A9P4P652_9PLEO|nr:hypothetical protein P171DRAFT_184333 [Karstenula rhodostoma CBS 690.94]